MWKVCSVDPHAPLAALDPAAVATALAPCCPEVRVIARTDSTNADAAAWARAGAPDGAVVTADVQTAGRGRLDRSFSMPPRTGVAVSVIWRPEVPLRQWPWAPLAVGLAVDATLADLGLDPRLKWPNDVLVDGRKICGILLERVAPTDDQPAAAVVGIGLNVDLAEADLPVPHATSLRIAGATELDRVQVMARLLAHLAEARTAWEHGDAARLRADYLEGCDTVGRQVVVSLPDGSALRGPAETIDEHGRLVVAGRAVSAGDVTHVRPQS